MARTQSLAKALRDIPWAEPHPTKPNTVLVDPDKAYPLILGELGVDSPDQYWLETASQFVKMDLQVALKRFGFTIHIRSDDGRKARWNITMVPPGKGALAATMGKEAREHYRRLRGFIPA